LRARLRDLFRARAGQEQIVAAPGGGGVFSNNFARFHALIPFGGRETVFLEINPRNASVRAGELQVRQLRFPIRFGGGDSSLRGPASSSANCAAMRSTGAGSSVASSAAIGWLLVSEIAFLREQFCDTAASNASRPGPRPASIVPETEVGRNGRKRSEAA